MLFSVRGKFGNQHTFTVNPVDAPDAAAALTQVQNLDDVKSYAEKNGGLVMTTVKALSGRKGKVKISDAPAAERKGGGRKPKAPAQTPAPASSGSRKR